MKYLNVLSGLLACATVSAFALPKNVRPSYKSSNQKNIKVKAYLHILDHNKRKSYPDSAYWGEFNALNMAFEDTPFTFELQKINRIKHVAFPNNLTMIISSPRFQEWRKASDNYTDLNVFYVADIPKSPSGFIGVTWQPKRTGTTNYLNKFFDHIIFSQKATVGSASKARSQAPLAHEVGHVSQLYIILLDHFTKLRINTDSTSGSV